MDIIQLLLSYPGIDINMKLVLTTILFNEIFYEQLIIFILILNEI